MRLVETLKGLTKAEQKPNTQTYDVVLGLWSATWDSVANCGSLVPPYRPCQKQKNVHYIKHFYT